MGSQIVPNESGNGSVVDEEIPAATTIVIAQDNNNVNNDEQSSHAPAIHLHGRSVGFTGASVIVADSIRLPPVVSRMPNTGKYILIMKCTFPMHNDYNIFYVSIRNTNGVWWPLDHVGKYNDIKLSSRWRCILNYGCNEYDVLVVNIDYCFDNRYMLFVQDMYIIRISKSRVDE